MRITCYNYYTMIILYLQIVVDLCVEVDEHDEWDDSLQEIKTDHFVDLGHSCSSARASNRARKM